MKVHSDELYQLIQSLEPHEKGYFKRFVNENKLNSQSKIYLLLFDVLERMREYDEKVLQRRLRGKVNLLHLSKLKNYLMEAILECLEFYHDDTTPLLIINKYMARIELLLKKTFYKRALKTIHQAQALAEKYELFYHQLHLSLIESNTNNFLHQSSDRHSEELKQVIEEHKEINQKISNVMEYNLLKARTHALHQRMYQARTEEEKKAVQGLLSNPLLKDISNASSFKSKFGFLYCEGGLHFMAGHMEKFTENYMEQILLFETLDKEALAHQGQEYLTAINNAITPQSLELAEGLCSKGLTFYEGLPHKLKTKQKRLIMVLIKSNYAIALQQHLQFEEALKIAKEEIAVCRANRFKHLNSEIELYSISFCSAFIMEDYKEALKYVNYALAMKESPTILKTSQFFRLANLMVHYELGNLDALPYLAASAERFLKKNKVYGGFEKKLVALFDKTLPQTSGQKETQKVFSDLFSKANHLIPRHEISEGFRFEPWIRAKMEGRKMEQVLREERVRK